MTGPAEPYPHKSQAGDGAPETARDQELNAGAEVSPGLLGFPGDGVQVNDGHGPYLADPYEAANDSEFAAAASWGLMLLEDKQSQLTEQSTRLPDSGLARFRRRHTIDAQAIVEQQWNEDKRGVMARANEARLRWNLVQDVMQGAEPYLSEAALEQLKNPWIDLEVLRAADDFMDYRRRGILGKPRVLIINYNGAPESDDGGIASGALPFLLAYGSLRIDLAGDPMFGARDLELLSERCSLPFSQVSDRQIFTDDVARPVSRYDLIISQNHPAPHVIAPAFVKYSAEADVEDLWSLLAPGGRFIIPHTAMFADYRSHARLLDANVWAYDKTAVASAVRPYPIYVSPDWKSSAAAGATTFAVDKRPR